MSKPLVFGEADPEEYMKPALLCDTCTHSKDAHHADVGCMFDDHCPCHEFVVEDDPTANHKVDDDE